MIFSKLALDLNNPSARQALRNCHDMHRNLMKAFRQAAEEVPRNELGVLYRVSVRKNQVFIYVLSKELPDWMKVAGNGLACVGLKDLSGVEKTIRSGHMLRFNILAATMKKVPVEGRNSRRIFLKTEEERLNWLEHKASQNGFRLMICKELKQVKQYGNKTRDGLDAMYLQGVVFSGVLKVIDTEKFMNAFENGIGAEKAYGMGMLMVSKV